MAQLGTRWQDSTAPPFGPARGSQPGAQAGRHALEGQEMWVLTLSLSVNRPQRSAQKSERTIVPESVPILYILLRIFVKFFVS